MKYAIVMALLVSACNSPSTLPPSNSTIDNSAVVYPNDCDGKQRPGTVCP